MNTQMIICILLFIAMLVGFLRARLPLGVTAGTVAILLVLAGCTSPETILGSIGDSNNVIIACMIILASGLGRTSFPSKLTSGIRKITRGSYKLAYLGILLVGLLLTSILTSPMAAYAIVFPMMDSVCDEFGVSRSKAQFPLVVVCIACCSILPSGASISRAAIYDGFMQTYGFTQGFSAMDLFRGRWPFLIIMIIWAYFIAPKFTPDKPVAPITTMESKASSNRTLSSFSNIAGVVIFFLVILGFVFGSRLGIASWLITFAGVMAMVICNTLTKAEAIKALPVDFCLLYVGANTVATALVDTGTGEFIGSIISQLVGGVTNTYILHAAFFIVPFAITQFMQNASVMNVFAPIALIVCSALGADPRGCLVLVTAGSLSAYMTPSATAAIPMCMGAGGYDVKTLFKMSWLLSLILCICYVIFVSIVLPAF